MRGSCVCSECGRGYPLDPSFMTCPVCSAQQKEEEPLRGVLEVQLEGDVPPGWEKGEAHADPRDLLPVEGEYFPPIPVGNTPLWEPRRLREELGLKKLYLKDDTPNPTGSFKDRASYLVAAFARKHGLQKVVLASTGNAGSSMAGVGAAAGLDVRLYLPASAPPAKLVQARQYGADLVTVEGTYDQAYNLSLAYVKEKGGLSRNTAHNPLTIEGKKTASLEIFRDLKALPHRIYVSAGDGVILSGLYKGFEDLQTLGITQRVPQITACQAQGSSALYRALETGGFGPPVPSKTLADSISVDVPRGGWYALKKLQAHGGRVLMVEDQDILKAQYHLSRSSGLFAEPAGAAAFAGLLADCQAGRGPGPEEIVVLLITGNGLKDIKAASQVV